MKSIKKNYIYNLIYQCFTLVAPLVTTPYVSRVLGAERIGEYSYAYSLVYYFTLAAILGTATYGEREISFYQDDRRRRSERFWDIYFLRVITSTICFITYCAFIHVVHPAEKIYLIVSLNIIAVGLDFVWLFQGMEEFGKITLRDGIVKFISICCIFLFVKKETDILIYTLILSLIPVISALSLYPYLKKYVNKPDINNIRPFNDFKNIIELFIPTVAISIYAMLDKTMIGIFTTTKIENGYYEQAMKVSKTALTIVTSLGTVLIPRISFYFQKNEKKLIEDYMYKSYRFVWFLGIPICFGLIGISKNLVPWFYGSGFEKVEYLLIVLSFLVIIIGISNVTGLQYLVPTKRQNYLTKSVVAGSIVNVVLNSIFIPRYLSIGAAIASVIAEFTVSATQLFFVRKELNVKYILSTSAHYFLAGSIMLIVLILAGFELTPSFINTFILIIAGSFIYFFVLLLIKDSFSIELLKSAIARIKR